MSELEKKGKKRKLDDYFKDDGSIQTEISKAWDAINDSQDAEEVDDEARTVASDLELAKEVSAGDDEAKEVEEEEDYENDNDDNLIQPLKKRKTETGQIKEPVESVFRSPSEVATGQIKHSQQEVYKKLKKQKLSKFMETHIVPHKHETEHDMLSEPSKAESTPRSVYSHHFDDEDDDKTVGHDDSTEVTGHGSIQSKDEYIELNKIKDGKIQRKVTQVNNDNINGLKYKFQNIINKYKKHDRVERDILLEELEHDYSYVFGNMGLLFYKYKKDKSNLHNAFFPTLLGKHVKLDDDTFERIYKKQMVLDLCLFVYNLNLFEKIHRPYTYITYNFVVNDDATKGEKSDAFSIASSVASSKSNRDNIEAIRKEQNKEVIDTVRVNKSEFIPNDLDPDSQLTEYNSDGGKKSKSNQGGKKGQNKGPNKGPKKNHKTNKKRSNRSFMMKIKKSKPRKTQRKKNSKKKTQRKKLIVKKDLKKKTKRVRFAL